MKKMKVYTKLIIGYIILDLLVVICLYFGYKSVNQVLVATDPESYIRHYNIFSVCMLVICIGIVGFISVNIARTIRKSIKQLAEAAEQMAAGRVDIELKKMRDDEFGNVIDKYQIVIDNIRE